VLTHKVLIKTFVRDNVDKLTLHDYHETIEHSGMEPRSLMSFLKSHEFEIGPIFMVCHRSSLIIMHIHIWKHEQHNEDTRHT
jgi:hypothetical protein